MSSTASKIRSQDDICEEIAKATDQQRGDLIRRIRAFDWDQKRKDDTVQFIMLLGMVGGNSTRN